MSEQPPDVIDSHYKPDRRKRPLRLLISTAVGLIGLGLAEIGFLGPGLGLGAMALILAWSSL